MYHRDPVPRAPMGQSPPSRGVHRTLVRSTESQGSKTEEHAPSGSPELEEWSNPPRVDRWLLPRAATASAGAAGRRRTRWRPAAADTTAAATVGAQAGEQHPQRPPAEPRRRQRALPAACAALFAEAWRAVCLRRARNEAKAGLQARRGRHLASQPSVMV